MNEIVNIFTDGKSANNTIIYLYGKRMNGLQYFKFTCDVDGTLPSVEMKLLPLLIENDSPFETNKWSIRCSGKISETMIMYHYKPIYLIKKLELIAMITDKDTVLKSTVVWIDKETKNELTGSLEDLEEYVLKQL